MPIYHIIIQARMTSTRLPGKVMLECQGEPFLSHQLQRLSKMKNGCPLTIATTTNESDLPIVELCNKKQISFYRGSEVDVLDRYFQAAKIFNAQNIIRITSDCPLIDPAAVDLTISQFENGKYDYISNSKAFPNGMNAEIFSSSMLSEAHKNGLKAFEREHVTPYFYTRPEKYRIGHVQIEHSIPKYRLTLDTPEDLILIKKIFDTLYPRNKDFTLKDICNLMQENPDWALINSHIHQKKYDE